MSVISMKQLLEAGVHFGHQTRRWNPKMAPYIYTERNGIYIIDLQKSVGKVDEAYKAVSDIAADGGSILFVGTKKQAQEAVKEEAQRCGMYYVNERWLGGMLTNFKTIQSRIKRLKDIERMSEDGTFDVLPKKEVVNIKKEWDKLEKNLGGIKEMKRIPDAIFVVDPKKERICVQEAHALGITLIGIADTNCDPEELDYVIPGNDDAIRAVKLIVSKMAEDGTFDVLPKKEVVNIKKEWDKLEKNLGGIKEMKRIPDAIFVVDPKKEKICVQEAHALGIKLIGIADTNCDPEELDYVIPGNDDAIRAVKLIVSKMADAVIEANQGEEMVAEEAAADAE